MYPDSALGLLTWILILAILAGIAWRIWGNRL